MPWGPQTFAPHPPSKMPLARESSPTRDRPAPPSSQKFGPHLPAALSLHMARINTPTGRSKSPSKFFGEGLTFHDVLLLPAFSKVLPLEADIRSSLPKDTTLTTPILPPPTTPATPPN